MAQRPGGTLVIATDADVQREKYAARLTAMAQAAGVPAERAKPPSGHNDWNDVLKARSQAAVQPSHPRFSAALTDVAHAMEPPEPSTRPPWEPAPVRMAERVRAFEARDALRAAEAMAVRNNGEPRPPQEQRRGAAPTPGAQP